MTHLKQSGYDIRCEWGIHGIHTLLEDSDVIIIVDILSFSTAVDIVVSRQAIVYPFAERGQKAEVYAQEKEAFLAKKRPQSNTEFSLSPASLQRLPVKSKIVIPSPNGSTLSMATGDTITLAGCLRNARAVAEYAQTQGKRISVIPAGERFVYSDTDTALRPSLEDLIGAGAILSHLKGKLSPEAHTAQLIYQAHRDNLSNVLLACVSGRELVDTGYTEDVMIASHVNISHNTPMLIKGAYQNPHQ